MNSKFPDFLNHLEKKNKKRYQEEIFMPKFFLNLINLSKKAKKLGRNSLNLLDQEYLMNSKTYLDNIPSIKNYKNDNYNKKENSNNSTFTKIKYMSSLNNPGRIIIKPSLPKINYKANTVLSLNNNKRIDNNIPNDKIMTKDEEYNNGNSNASPENKIKYPSSLTKNNSYTFLHNNPNNETILNNIIFAHNIRLNNDNFNTKDSINFNNNREYNSEKKYIKINKFNFNKTNNISLNKFLDLFIKNKIRQLYSKKNNIINVKKIKEKKKEDLNKNINSISQLKELSIKTNNSFRRRNQIFKNMFSPLKKLTNFSINFNNKDDISSLFMNKKLINYSINSNIILNSQIPIFYYYINKMYRKQIIKYMKHRLNWKFFDYNNNNNKIKINNEEQKININFEWKYFSNRLNYKNYKYDSNIPIKKLRMINLFEKNYEIGNKKNMFLNLMAYCDKIKYNIFEIVPFTLIISYKRDLEFAMKTLKRLIEFIDKNKDNNNHIILDRKYNEYFWYDKNYAKITNQIIYINKNFISEENYWIIKPTDLYQGKYIEICNTYDDINRICINMFKGINENINKEEDDEENQNNDNLNKQKNIIKKSIYSKMYCCNDIIIQKYLDNPLLYKKRKFDIRCFVLLDSNLNLFYCREGHLKGSSELYNVKNANKFIHITNYSFQKKSSKFQKYEEGNEISYNDFKLFLKEEKIPLEKFDLMIEQIKFLIKVSFKSVSKKLYKTNNVLCFELFGYDFIIDNDFKPWILEINNNPGLCISSSVIKKIVPRMIDDAFRLTIDKVFETKYSEECIDINGKYKSRFPIEGYTDDENIFEFLCNIK